MNRSTLLGLILAALLLAGVGSCSKPPGQAEYDRGLYELKRDNAVRAKSLLEKSITRRPGAEENALAYNYLGVAAWKLGQFQAAQEAFEDSRRLGPSLVEPVLNLALLAASSGDQLRALKLLEEAARLDERDARALEHMARLYADKQQWPEARRMLYAALDRAPGSPRILTALANVELKAKGPQKAIETLLQALEHNARYAPALFNMALIYDTELQDAAHARSYYRRFLGVAGAGTQSEFARKAMTRVDRVTPAREPAPVSEPVAPVAPVVVETTAPERPATPVTPAPPPVVENPVQAVVRRAALLVEKGDSPGGLNLLLDAAAQAQRDGRTAEQEKFLQDAARLCFDEPRAHFELGRFLLAQNKTEAALRSFKQATTLDRNYAAAHLAMARAALQTGEYDTALVGFQSAVKADPRDAEALWELTQLLDVKLKNSDRALEAYRDFERLFPRDARVLQAVERARALAAASKPPEPPPAVTATPRPAPVMPAPRPGTVAPPVVVKPSAEVVTEPVTPKPARPIRQVNYRPPVTPNPRAAAVAFNQGAQYQQQGKWDSAIQYYLNSLANDDRVGTTFYNLGSAYAAQGDYELAKDAYLRALQLQPDLVAARYNLALLYFQAGDLTATEPLLLEVVRQRPDYAAAHYTLGMVYASHPSRLDKAKQAYQRYLQLAPNEPSAASVRQWLDKH